MKNTFKKPLLLLVVGLLVVAGASAALLSAFGVIELEADVEQSVLVDGNQYDEPILEGVNPMAGASVCMPHNIENRAVVDIPLLLESTDEEGIEVTYRIAQELDLALNLDDLVLPSGNTFDELDVTVTRENGYVVLSVTENDPVKYPMAMFFISNADDEYRFRAGFNQIAESNGWETFYQDEPMDGPTPVNFATQGFNGSVNRTNDTIVLMMSEDELNEGDKISFNIQAAGDGSRGQHRFPKDFDANTPSTQAPVILAEYQELGNSFTIDAETSMDFEICYDFHWALVPQVYNIQTEVQPNLAE
jgi:hypothetical protein